MARKLDTPFSPSHLSNTSPNSQSTTTLTLGWIWEWETRWPLGWPRTSWGWWKRARARRERCSSVATLQECRAERLNAKGTFCSSSDQPRIDVRVSIQAEANQNTTRLLPTAVADKNEEIKSVVHLCNVISKNRSVDGMPFVSLGERPVSMAVPVPVQLGDGIFHALYKSVDRTHAVLRVFGATLEGRQRDDAVIYDDSNLLGRGKGGVCARQHYWRERK